MSTYKESDTAHSTNYLIINYLKESKQKYEDKELNTERKGSYKSNGSWEE